MKRVLFVQPSVQPPGGGNGVAAWMLQALVQDCDVSMMAWTPFEPGEINRFFGTSLSRSDLRNVYVVPQAVRRLLDAIPLPLSLLKSSVLFNRVRDIAGEFDVIVTADNEHDFGRPGIQYVHYPRCLFPRPAVDLRWYHYPKAFLNAYYAVCNSFSSLSLDGLERNLTLVNSDYIGGLVRQRYQITPRTIYPPVTATFPDVPWESREDAFVCVGRIAPEKELERVIAIIARVRQRFPAVQLRFVGTPGLRSYYKRIRAIVAREPWISLHENLSREELVAFVPRHRYGIHGMLEEHFGMAPAEMVRAGCIVFVPRGGGQVEIVGRDERLCYRSVEEAADSICATMADPDRQADLRRVLAARQPLFSTDRFVSEIRGLISAFPSPPPLPPA